MGQFCDRLLASKYNPMKIGRGESGMNSYDSSLTASTCTSTTAGGKRKLLDESTKQIVDTIKSFMYMYNHSKNVKV